MSWQKSEKITGEKRESPWKAEILEEQSEMHSERKRKPVVEEKTNSRSEKQYGAIRTYPEVLFYLYCNRSLPEEGKISLVYN